MKKLTFEFVKQYFEDRDCELLETEYKNNSTKMRYRCKCEEVDKICFSGFKKRTKCIGHSNNTKKLTLDYVKQYFEDHNCKLLETEYINNHTPMKYECSCGNSDCKICFNNFKNGVRCMECGVKKSSIKQSYDYKYVYNFFKEHDCLLLEIEYINNKTLMKYECDCGNPDCRIRFNDFQQGLRCMECSGSKNIHLKKLNNILKIMIVSYLRQNI